MGQGGSPLYSITTALGNSVQVSWKAPALNTVMLRYAYPGTTGLKTGYTLASGRCLVATAERHGVSLGVVLLDSPNPATQARKLLDSAFESVYHQRPVAEPPIPPGA